MAHLSYTSLFEKEAETGGFSGTVLLKRQREILASAAYGYANVADSRRNLPDTRFGIASGSKLLTGIAVCLLIDRGMLAPDSKVLDILNKEEFPLFDPGITVHHLLTHSSGIPDYFDEETMEDFSDLWKEQPMYLLRRPRDFLPMFSHLPMAFVPGARFQYNNSGYILLGLLVEELSGLSFTEFVERNIFAPCGMEHSGYYALDQLPENTALGYIEEAEGGLRTNIYSIPVQGGPDGGVFVNAPDMLQLWEALLEHRLLRPETTSALLTPHIHAGKDNYYGYGVWITVRGGAVYKYHLMGYDPGVSFHSAFYPASGLLVAALCNRSQGSFRMIRALEEATT